MALPSRPCRPGDLVEVVNEEIGVLANRVGRGEDLTDYLTTLMRYKAWANELVFAAAAKLPEAELTAPRKIVFGNMLRTLNHVYAMDEVWRAHLEGRSHGSAARNPDACPTLAELQEAQRAMDAWWVDYGERLTRSEAGRSRELQLHWRRPGVDSAARYPAARRQPRHLSPRQRGEHDVPGGNAAADRGLPVVFKRPA